MAGQPPTVTLGVRSRSSISIELCLGDLRFNETKPSSQSIEEG